MKRDRAWWPIAVYPTAFPLAMILLIWGEAEINVMELIRPVIVVIAVSLSITLVLSLLAGDRRLGGIAATASIVALVVDRPQASVALFAITVVIVIVARLQGSREIRYLSTASRALQIVATVALLASAIFVVSRPGFGPNVFEAFLAPPGPADRPDPPAGAPDIFVYLIDGYPGRTAAAQAPSFDPTVFPAALAARGFTVHDDARTNYMLTRLVLPSMFDGRHIKDIPGLGPPFGPDQAVDARRLREALEASAGLAAIRAAGYDLMWVSSGWSHLDIRNVDRRIESLGPSEFEIALLRQTGVGNVLQAIDPNGYSRSMRERTRAAFESASALAAEPHARPRFVFVHVPAPHPPTVFRADGSPENGSPDASWDVYQQPNETKELRRERVFAQVQAIGSMTIAGVDDVLANSGVPPVIVVFSDHGTDISFDAGAPVESDTEERSSAFLAALTPGHPDLFATPTTPVNIISGITNAYMGTAIPRRPDVTYAYDGSVLNVVPIHPTPGD